MGSGAWVLELINQLHNSSILRSQFNLNELMRLLWSFADGYLATDAFGN